MQEQLKPITPTRDNVRHTRVIRFWSEGKISESAYNRIGEHRSKNHLTDAKTMLSEWLID